MDHGHGGGGDPWGLCSIMRVAETWLRCGGWPPRTPGRAGDFEEPPVSPEIPGLAGRRAGSMQNPAEETGWARRGAGPHAPRPPQTPAPTRAPQHPGVHLPARGCCRTTALRGHPPRYVPATPAAIVTTVPTAGPRGEPVSLALPRTLSPSADQGGARGSGAPTCASGGCPAPASSGPEVFPSVPPSLCLGVPSVAPGTCARCPRRPPLPRYRWPRGARPALGGPRRGDGPSVLLGGWERTRRSQEPGLPGNVALSPGEGVTEVPPGWGAVSDCFRDPRLGLLNSLSFQLRSDPLGNPSLLLPMFSLCRFAVFKSPGVCVPLLSFSN